MARKLRSKIAITNLKKSLAIGAGMTFLVGGIGFAISIPVYLQIQSDLKQSTNQLTDISKFMSQLVDKLGIPSSGGFAQELSSGYVVEYTNGKTTIYKDVGGKKTLVLNLNDDGSVGSAATLAGPAALEMLSVLEEAKDTIGDDASALQSIMKDYADEAESVSVATEAAITGMSAAEILARNALSTSATLTEAEKDTLLLQVASKNPAVNIGELKAAKAQAQAAIKERKDREKEEAAAAKNGAAALIRLKKEREKARAKIAFAYLDGSNAHRGDITSTGVNLNDGQHNGELIKLYDKWRIFDLAQKVEDAKLDVMKQWLTAKNIAFVGLSNSEIKKLYRDELNAIVHTTSQEHQATQALKQTSSHSPTNGILNRIVSSPASWPIMYVKAHYGYINSKNVKVNRSHIVENSIKIILMKKGMSIEEYKRITKVYRDIVDPSHTGVRQNKIFLTRVINTYGEKDPSIARLNIMKINVESLATSTTTTGYIVARSSTKDIVDFESVKYVKDKLLVKLINVYTTNVDSPQFANQKHIMIEHMIAFVENKENLLVGTKKSAEELMKEFSSISNADTTYSEYKIEFIKIFFKAILTGQTIEFDKQKFESFVDYIATADGFNKTTPKIPLGTAGTNVNSWGPLMKQLLKDVETNPIIMERYAKNYQYAKQIISPTWLFTAFNKDIKTLNIILDTYKKSPSDFIALFNQYKKVQEFALDTKNKFSARTDYETFFKRDIDKLKAMIFQANSTLEINTIIDNLKILYGLTYIQNLKRMAELQKLNQWWTSLKNINFFKKLTPTINVFKEEDKLDSEQKRVNALLSVESSVRVRSTHPLVTVWTILTKELALRYGITLSPVAGYKYMFTTYDPVSGASSQIQRMIKIVVVKTNIARSVFVQLHPVVLHVLNALDKESIKDGTELMAISDVIAKLVIIPKYNIWDFNIDSKGVKKTFTVTELLDKWSVVSMNGFITFLAPGRLSSEIPAGEGQGQAAIKLKNKSSAFITTMNNTQSDHIKILSNVDSNGVYTASPQSHVMHTISGHSHPNLYIMLLKGLLELNTGHNGNIEEMVKAVVAGSNYFTVLHPQKKTPMEIVNMLNHGGSISEFVTLIGVTIPTSVKSTLRIQKARIKKDSAGIAIPGEIEIKFRVIRAGVDDFITDWKTFKGFSLIQTDQGIVDSLVYGDLNRSVTAKILGALFPSEKKWKMYTRDAARPSDKTYGSSAGLLSGVTTTFTKWDQGSGSIHYILRYELNGKHASFTGTLYNFKS